MDMSMSLSRKRRQAKLRRSIHASVSWSGNEPLGTQIEHVSKRREANARERLRVKNLNAGFAKLRRILPTVPPNRKPSKVDTLQGAIEYIQELQHVLRDTGGIPNICAPHSRSRQAVTESPFIVESSVNANNALSIRYTPNIPPCYVSPESPRNTFFEGFVDLEKYPGYVERKIEEEKIFDRLPQMECSSSGLPSPTSSVTSESSVDMATTHVAPYWIQDGAGYANEWRENDGYFQNEQNSGNFRGNLYNYDNERRDGWGIEAHGSILPVKSFESNMTHTLPPVSSLNNSEITTLHV